MVPDTTSQSSTSTPKSQKAALDPNLSQVSESTLASVGLHELTPPSSVASAHEQHEEIGRVAEEPRLMSSPSTVTGKKRTANGLVKGQETEDDVGKTTQAGHVRNVSRVSDVGTGVGELSQQLRTKLTYAMLKVQNGWQQHSLDEIESIASQSPRSNFSGIVSRNFQSMVSPRSAIAASKRQNSDTSTSSGHSSRHRHSIVQMPEPMNTPGRRALAPPAPIVSGNRRRQAPNGNLHINSSLKPSPRSIRPVATQRTPSQNAAMEADAVETLLFMSASPNNTTHFSSHLSAYSPTSQAFSTQTSPLKTQFSPNDRMYPPPTLGYSPGSSYRRVRYEDKAALIDRLLSGLDDDESEELDRAVKIMDRHHASKLSA